MVVWIAIVVVAVGLVSVAWWSSGRVRGRAPSGGVRGDAESGAMKHYRPPGATPPNIGGGG
jgi:hypothetical protein